MCTERESDAKIREPNINVDSLMFVHGKKMMSIWLNNLLQQGAGEGMH
jgi:hypothetical protein